MLSSFVRYPSRPFAIPEYEFPASTVFPGMYFGASRYSSPSSCSPVQYFESAAARELFEFQVNFYSLQVLEAIVHGYRNEGHRKRSIQTVYLGSEKRGVPWR